MFLSKPTLLSIYITCFMCLHAFADRVSRVDRIAAKYGKKGGMIKLCMDGDKCKHMIQMKLQRLIEITSNGTNAGRKAENFNLADFNWEAPVRDTMDGNNRTKISFRAKVDIGKKALNKTIDFDMITYIYLKNGTAKNGNETINVAKGSLKFSINITGWPWKNETNQLKFGVNMIVRSKEGKAGEQNPKRKRLNGKTKIDRLELGEGAFMDAPETCFADNVAATTVTKTAPLGNNGIDIDWVFPHFTKNLFYDPVIGDTTAEAQQSDSNDTNATPTPTPEPENDASCNNASMLSAVAFILFSWFLYQG